MNIFIPTYIFYTIGGWIVFSIIFPTVMEAWSKKTFNFKEFDLTGYIYTFLLPLLIIGYLGSFLVKIKEWFFKKT